MLCHPVLKGKWLDSGNQREKWKENTISFSFFTSWYAHIYAVIPFGTYVLFVIYSSGSLYLIRVMVASLLQCLYTCINHWICESKCLHNMDNKLKNQYTILLHMTFLQYESNTYVTNLESYVDSFKLVAMNMTKMKFQIFFSCSKIGKLYFRNW